MTIVQNGNPANQGFWKENAKYWTEKKLFVKLLKVEPQENGQFCVFKTLPIESIEKTAVQQCVHRFVFVFAFYMYIFICILICIFICFQEIL